MLSQQSRARGELLELQHSWITHGALVKAHWSREEAGTCREPAGRVLSCSERSGISGIPCSRNPWEWCFTGEFTALEGQSRQRSLLQSYLVASAEVSITGEILRLPGQGSNPTLLAGGM